MSHRRGSLVLLLLALVGGALLAVVGYGLRDPINATVYGPAYERDPIGGQAEMGRPPAEGVAPKMPGDDGIAVRDPGIMSGLGQIAGRVLDTSNQAVKGCQVALKWMGVGYRRPVSVATDAEGYFACSVERGSYQATASAIGYCMFPAQPANCVTDGGPVRIYMHAFLRFTLIVKDIRGRPIAMPYSCKVRVAVDGAEIPEPGNLATIPEMWRRGSANETDAPMARSVIRVLGTDFDGAIRENRWADIEVHAPGLVVQKATITLSEAMAEQSTISVVAEPSPGWVPTYVNAGYDSGAPLMKPFILDMTCSGGHRMQYWGVDPLCSNLMVLPSGSCSARLGVFSFAMQGVDFEVPNVSYGAVHLKVARRGDIAISMIDARTGSPQPFGRVELGSSKPVKGGGISYVSAIWSMGDPYRIIDLPAGDYVVKAMDITGKPYEGVANVGQVGEVTVVLIRDP